MIDLGPAGRMSLAIVPDGGPSCPVIDSAEFTLPLTGEDVADLRWYLEEYLSAPFSVYEDRGTRIAARLPEWGRRMFGAVFRTDAAVAAYDVLRDRASEGKPTELVLRSAIPESLAQPWELLHDNSPGMPVAQHGIAISRSLPGGQYDSTVDITGERLRVLMIIARPAGVEDVDYQLIARPLLARLAAAARAVDLVVLRPPTLDALTQAVLTARLAGEPFHIVHFDGHGALFPGQGDHGESGALLFDSPDGGVDYVSGAELGRRLAAGQVPVAVLNACQSGAVGKQVESAVATSLLAGGVAAVVGMAYNVFAVAAAEFMATFYERLFAGGTVAEATTAGRAQLAARPGRPSPRGDMPLADWFVPVLYLRQQVRFPELRAARPPADDDAPPDADQLAPQGEFVGRDALFYELEVGARSGRVLVLHGPAGTGKTELAKAFGRWRRDTGGVDQPGWVIWHSFEPGIASFGLPALLATIGLRVYGPGFGRLDLSARRNAVRELFEQRRLLLVCDNLEAAWSMPDPTGATPPLGDAELAELRDFLVDAAAGGRSTVLVTSRTPEDWLGDVCRIRLGNLTFRESAQYADALVAASPRARASRAQRAFAELLTELDGHPLSMRLLLPHLETLAPEEILAGLRGTGPLPADAMPADGRTGSLAAGIAYSIGQLSASDQRRMAAVSLFLGVADVDVLDALSQVEQVPARFRGVSRDDWLGVLDRAVHVGLLTELPGGMYEVHPALPAFLVALWQEQEPDVYATDRMATDQAFLTAYVAFARWLTPQSDTSAAPLVQLIVDLQRRTMGQLLGRALDTGQWRAAQELATPLTAYLQVRALDEEIHGWVGRIRTAVAEAVGTPPPLDHPAGVLWLTSLSRSVLLLKDAGRLDEAGAVLDEIDEVLRAQANPDRFRSAMAVCWHQRGQLAQLRGQWTEAEHWYRRALAVEELLGDPASTANTYHQLGRIAQLRGRWDDAEQWYARTLAIRQQLDDRPGVADSYFVLGWVARAQGRPADAQQFHRHSLVIREQLGDRRGMAESAHELGMAAQLTADWDEAQQWYRHALTIREQIGDRPGLSSSYLQLGVVAGHLERWEDATQWYERALAIVEDIDDRQGTSVVYYQLGRLAQARGLLADADRWYRRSLEIDTELDDQSGLAQTSHQLGVVAQLDGRWADAEQWYLRALAVRTELKDRPGVAVSCGQIALLADQLSQPDSAMEWLVRCVALFEEFPHPATESGPTQLARLTAKSGIVALEQCWLRVTGTELPEQVRQFVETTATEG